MAEDREILREIWDGQIPICFRLASEEIYTLQHPEPFYLMVPRLTYFPLLSDKIQKHFSNHVKDDIVGAEMWIDYDSQPLKWHYPVGLLFDYYGSDAKLPWNVTVHFKDFPETELIHCPNKMAVQSHFMSTVKEASALKHRTQLVQSMLPRNTRNFGKGLRNINLSNSGPLIKDLWKIPVNNTSNTFLLDYISLVFL
ncbi:Autophagy protein 5 like protein [Argiope bruennichi]|uniref:Autophagy protein 5 like protein n=1 Tax=Argiope bruennichi TaxID=94029 RepID=A0A8T0EPS7_ARGBR|nr:Autophagy protein 5 like protein [Argiope bruennichi]